MNAPEFFRLVIKEKQKIRCLELHSQLEDGFAKLLLLHPFTESEEKVWNKLPTTNKQLGFLSRKLIKTAKKVGIPQPMIEYFVTCKKKYKYFKNQTYMYEELFDIDEAVKLAFKAGRSTERKEKHIMELWMFTKLLLKSVIDKSNNEINKLAEK